MMGMGRAVGNRIYPLGSKALRDADAAVDLGTGVRKFETGATRDVAEGKPDLEGYIDPEVLRRFCAYMEQHQHMADGSLRESDNWKNMFGPTPKDHKSVCMKSMLRHVQDLWLFHRGYKGRETIEAALAGTIFNALAYWFGIVKEEQHDPVS